MTIARMAQEVRIVLIGDDLIAFVNKKLSLYLQGFKQRAPGPDTIEYIEGRAHAYQCAGLDLEGGFRLPGTCLQVGIPIDPA